MGSCISSPAASRRCSNLQLQTAMANVISSNGQLRQYTVPINVSQVLFSSDDQVGNYSEFFLCNSDRLYYDEHMKAMDTVEELQAGQIYFQLPSSRLRHPLTAYDMAALAVKASIALNRVPPPPPQSKSDSNHYHRRQNKMNRISPVLELSQSKNNIDCKPSSSYGDREQRTVKKLIRTGQVKKLQRLSYRSRPRTTSMADRSSKVSLSTIYEGSVLL